MNERIAAVVVTYNRKKMLIECLEAIVNQTYKPDAIFIIDNNSNDGTPEELKIMGYIAELPSNESSEVPILFNKHIEDQNCAKNISIIYIKKNINDGSAGGFHYGMNLAHQNAYDWLWIMDDDGIPEQNCLELLFDSRHLSKFIAPLVVDKSNSELLSFRLGKIKNRNELEKITVNNIIIGYSNPWNGILISKDIIDKIGLPNKKMFIWGDEVEYLKRVLQVEKTITVTNAIFRHPPERMISSKKFAGIDFTEPADITRRYIFYRNYSYIYSKYNFYKLIKFFFGYCFYFLILKTIDTRGIILFLTAFWNGIIGNFEKNRYLK